tara:strand:- start:25 stop:471 length:447 start_codon:yes stop_codon:yes gene_type:complete
MKKIVFSVLILFSFACKDYAENTSPLHEIYEMRVYYTYEGRFDNILSRFENHTVKLFEKHGFNNVGYWTTEKKDSVSFADEFIFENGGKPALVYIVSFQNMDIRNKSWDKFINDPEWKKVYEESILDGPIVEKIEQVFLNPTNFSKLK